MEKIDENMAFGLTAPLPYVLITSLDKLGKPNAMGAAWVTRVSMSPPLIMVSIAPQRYSHKGIEFNKEFVVCYPSVGQEKGALICGTKTGRDGDKFAKAGLSVVPSLKVKPPTIKDSTVAFECKVVDTFVAGDHTLFIGEVVATTGTLNKEKHLFGTSKFKLFAMDESGKQ
ncbi:MAG: flavin reductase family protein [Methanomassiliicoccales archaeon]|jgi:flavin reductase (DIM6/NTAB) family NADH-FMN oxidoreductase RutF